MKNVTEWRCKACDGLLDLSMAVDGVVECKFCRNVYPMPKYNTSSEVLSYLQMGEHDLDTAKFDDAFAAFEKASQLDSNEPQAYFGMALAEFKVQQLKDDINRKIQPICHDISNRAFSYSKNYRKAYALATENQRKVYKSQSEDIDEIRREFFELQENGVGYDCFICVKVSDDGGEYTRDNHYAANIYDYLKESGYRPFYSEREVHGRSGSSYEALILYALMKSECMIVVCSNEEYLKTPWVKNEYTRFLRLVNDEEKESDAVTIAFLGKPIERLAGKRSKIQGIDLGKPDAFSLIEKYVEKHTPKARKQREEERQKKERESKEILRQIEEQKRAQRELELRLGNIKTQTAVNTHTFAIDGETLLVRAKQYIEMHKWQEAEKYFNQVLDLNPKCGEAWLGLLLVDFEVTDVSELSRSAVLRNKRIENNNIYNNFIIYGTESDKAKVDEQITTYNNTKELEKLEQKISKLNEEYIKLEILLANSCEDKEQKEGYLSQYKSQLEKQDEKKVSTFRTISAVAAILAVFGFIIMVVGRCCDATGVAAIVGLAIFLIGAVVWGVYWELAKPAVFVKIQKDVDILSTEIEEIRNRMADIQTESDNCILRRETIIKEIDKNMRTEHF